MQESRKSQTQNFKKLNEYLILGIKFSIDTIQLLFYFRLYQPFLVLQVICDLRKNGEFFITMQNQVEYATIRHCTRIEY